MYGVNPPNREDFSVNLALLANQWQGVVRRAQQRRGIIDSLLHQWHSYHEMFEKLLRWLQDVSRELDAHHPGGETVALQQARNMLDQIQVCVGNLQVLCVCECSSPALGQKSTVIFHTLQL